MIAANWKLKTQAKMETGLLPSSQSQGVAF